MTICNIRIFPSRVLIATDTRARVQVDTGAGVTTVQQVFTPMGERRRGFARALVGELTRRELAAGRAVTYLVDATNASSIALANQLGFRRHCDFGFLSVK